MENWLLAALISLVIYGFWGFFPKLAVSYIDPQSALVYEVAGAATVGLFALAFIHFQPETHPKGILFAVLTGIAGMAGTLFYFAAARNGKITVVVSITALYPLFTILYAALFLREPVSIKQLAGMVLALIAIVLLSG